MFINNLKQNKKVFVCVYMFLCKIFDTYLCLAFSLLETLLIVQFEKQINVSFF